MKLLERLSGFAKLVLDKYTILVGAILIYAYYLVLALDLFERHEQKRELLSLFLQFDSLILMWGVIFVLVQLKKIKQVKKDGEEKQKALLASFQRQHLQLASLDDISEMLNDRINNPLTVISLCAGSLRKRTGRNDDMGDEIDKIEGGLKRVQEVMMGIQSYHTKKIVKISRALMAEDEDLK
ncbi:MAG: hypothetical protein OEV30_02020 [Ignavibacteria bacterium]|nr:hypothetical protein [Ignavibacteria bacterium]